MILAFSYDDNDLERTPTTEGWTFTHTQVQSELAFDFLLIVGVYIELFVVGLLKARRLANAK